MKKLLHVALDVDDKGFSGAARDPITEELKEFRSRPNIGSLCKKLDHLKTKGYELIVCYESTHLGYSLARQLKGRGYDCRIVASSLIPELPGKKVKTNRIDAAKLVKFFQNGMLTEVFIPEEEDEADRDLLRSRRFLVEQYTDLKRHILSVCRRAGWDYKQETEGKSHWCKPHKKWLEAKMKESKMSSLKITMKLLLDQLQAIETNIEMFDTEVENMATSKKYNRRVRALTCYRGISNQSDLTIITELFDIKRFKHPKYIVSYAGFDLIEYSSGDKIKKYRCTKMGNRHLRTVLVEACQKSIMKPKVSKYLAKRRQGTDEDLIKISDRCMSRLHKKGGRLLIKGKNRNKVKVACAREMIGFIWESLNEAA